MSERQRVDPNLMKELKKYGISEWNACFHCGNCTAMCPLTEKGLLFPRKGIRSMQMGLKDKLAGSVEPWLCYYCGECSDTCPRDANPGELMMSLRRFLTSVYDWTGLSGKLYKSKPLHITVMIILFLVVLVSFLIFADFSVPAENGMVKINAFAPAHFIHLADTIFLGIISFFLLTNIFNMYYKVIIKDKTVNIPIWLYIKEIGAALVNFLTQLKFSKCERKKTYWLSHWLIMSSYIIMFVFIVVFLEWFQTDEVHPISHPQRWLGYYVTFGLLFATVYYFIGRFRKKDQIFKFSHHSDWIFIFLLFMIAVTGILIHIFRLSGMAQATYWMYTFHLAVEVPMVVTFVAFSKWSHIAYRPFAIYFSNLKNSARKLQEAR
jgi:quinone-modifying oxidoreductase subunit QmoC